MIYVLDPHGYKNYLMRIDNKMAYTTTRLMTVDVITVFSIALIRKNVKFNIENLNNGKMYDISIGTRENIISYQFNITFDNGYDYTMDACSAEYIHLPNEYYLLGKYLKKIELFDISFDGEFIDIVPFNSTIEIIHAQKHIINDLIDML